MTNRKRWLGSMVVLSLAFSVCVSAGAREYTTLLTGNRAEDTEYADAYVDDHTVQFGPDDNINPDHPYGIHIFKGPLTIRTDGTLNMGVVWVEDSTAPAGGYWQGPRRLEMNSNAQLTVDGRIRTGFLSLDLGSSVDAAGGDFGYIRMSGKSVANINMKEDGIPGSQAVTVGNIREEKGRTGIQFYGGTVNLALTTPQSSLRGAFSKKNGKGQLNLFLQNGARWEIDTSWGTGTTLDRLTGGADKDSRGIIHISSPVRDMQIDNYSGHTLIQYRTEALTGSEKDGENAELAILTAAPDSFVTLRTDRNGTEDEQGKISALLEKLANKLVYKGYTAGERNMDGEVEITEGLTAPSQIWKNGTLFFDGAGRGHLLNRLTAPITGTSADTAYVPYADEGFDTYTFSMPVLVDTGDAAAIQAAKPVIITGTVTIWGDMALSGGALTLNRNPDGGMNGKITELHGDLRGNGNARIGLDGFSVWQGAALQEGNLDLTMQSALWENGTKKSHERGSRVGRLQADKNALIRQKDGKPLTIDHFSGSLLLRYDHEAADPAVFSAGDTIIDTADAGARITLFTDNTGINIWDELRVRGVLDALAAKLVYRHYEEGSLTAEAGISEGLTSPAVRICGVQGRQRAWIPAETACCLEKLRNAPDG